ncbi:MAG: alpha/beta fold hydrolase [Pseudomonadota bacterium]
MTIRCAYTTTAAGLQVHYRRSGSGPPLVILHPSPQSSESMQPAITAFATLCTCIAFDTPGYGMSDPLPIDKPEFADYTDALIGALDALGIERFAVYGAATGSQLAIDIAKRYPQRVTFLMLDANGHISDSDCERIIASGYFADVTINRDGSHLVTTWEMCRQLYFAFPWTSSDPADRLGLDLPPAGIIHATLLRYLQAGERYALAYKAAMLAERRSHLDGVTTPAVMTRWVDSPVLSLADALIEQGLPDNVTVLNAGSGLSARFDVQKRALQDALEANPWDDCALRQPPAMSTLARTYIDTPAGQLHARVAGPLDAQPAVLLHRAGESSAQASTMITNLAASRRVIAPDLPEHGGSDRLADNIPLTVATLSDVLRGALQPVTATAVEWHGQGLGGALAMALGAVRQERVGIIDPVPYTSTERRAINAAALPDLSPRMDGTHVLAAWTAVRDAGQYFPAWDLRANALRARPDSGDPRWLHAKAVDALRLGTRWRAWQMLEIELDWQQLLAVRGRAQIDVRLTDAHPCPQRAKRLLIVG